MLCCYWRATDICFLWKSVCLSLRLDMCEWVKKIQVNTKFHSSILFTRLLLFIHALCISLCHTILFAIPFQFFAPHLNLYVLYSIYSIVLVATKITTAWIVKTIQAQYFEYTAIEHKMQTECGELVKMQYMTFDK